MSQPEMTDAEVAARNAKFKRRLPASAVDLATSMGLCLDDDTVEETRQVITHVRPVPARQARKEEHA